MQYLCLVNLGITRLAFLLPRQRWALGVNAGTFCVDNNLPARLGTRAAPSNRAKVPLEAAQDTANQPLTCVRGL